MKQTKTNSATHREHYYAPRVELIRVYKSLSILSHLSGEAVFEELEDGGDLDTV